LPLQLPAGSTTTATGKAEGQPPAKRGRPSKETERDQALNSLMASEYLLLIESELLSDKKEKGDSSAGGGGGGACAAAAGGGGGAAATVKEGD